MTERETGRRSRTIRGIVWQSLYVSEVTAPAYSHAATTSAHTIQRSSQNLRGYIDNGIVVLTMNNAIVDRQEKLANSILVVNTDKSRTSTLLHLTKS